MRLILTILILIFTAPANADSPIEYEVSFDNAAHHEARITVTWRDIPDETLQIRMSRSSPGRYAIHEFAKNVYDLQAVDGIGHPLKVSRPNPYQWDVTGHDGTVSVTYTLYADRAGGTYSGIDLTHAHLNMPATFMWARGFDDRPVRIHFVPPVDDWKAATQLLPTEDAMTFTAPDLQYFLDSPTELSNHSLRSWQVESNGKTYTIRLAVHHDGSEEDVDQYLEKAKKVVAAQIDIFGELPEFDYGTYTFIADYLPYVAGDGMEHRNSTILTSSRSLADADFAQLGTLSHEFIHIWNVERIRPASLEPFDFEHANMSANLWFAEGFTSYYGGLAIRRAGESSVDEYVGSLAHPINTITNSPGRNFASAAEMSMQAPFVDAASTIDPTNFSNTFISYYTYGSALGLALDLSLRETFEDINLDSLMRKLWQLHGKNEVPYTNDDLQQALAELTGSVQFSTEYFHKYVHGQQLPDYESLLMNAGLILRLANKGSATAGSVLLRFDDKKAIITRNTIIGSPLYAAGLDRGDQIIAIDRRKITSSRRWEKAVGRYEPGDSATIQYIQRGVTRSATITFVEDPLLEVVTYESANKDVSKEQLAFRAAWLESDSDAQ